MYILLALTSIFVLMMVYPIRTNLYLEDGLKCEVVLFGFIRVKVDMEKIYYKFVSRDDQNDGFNLLETIDNVRKLFSTRSFLKDMNLKTDVTEFYWYTAVPMNNELLGLASLPIYTNIQSVIATFVYNNFRSVKEADIDTTYNYMSDDTLLYFSCVLSITPLRSTLVMLKYMKKWPLLIKRITHKRGVENGTSNS